MMGIQGLYKTKKSWGGCHHLLLVYEASKLSTVYAVKSPVHTGSFHKYHDDGLQQAVFIKKVVNF